MRFWLMKSEPDEFSIDDLQRKNIEHWDGVRNFQARNYLRDQIKLKDKVLFYHSSAKEIGVAGLAEVCREGYPDFTAFDPKHPHYDSSSKMDKPCWYMVDVKFVEKFSKMVSLSVLKSTIDLSKMLVNRKGSRLSVQPVTAEEFKVVCEIGRGLR